MQYANQYRCEAAKDFLRGGQTVRETAELCGFNNLLFFTRMFKKCTEKMPSDYKNSNETEILRLLRASFCGHPATGAFFADFFLHEPRAHSVPSKQD